MNAAPPALLYGRDPGAPDARTTSREEARSDRDAGRRVLCASCRAAITTAADRFPMNGRHEHYFVNPRGFDFVVGCYRAAPGCATVGAPSAEFSWFPGYTWQIAVCAACRAHLGWRFSGGGAPFFALVCARLIDDDV